MNKLSFNSSQISINKVEEMREARLRKDEHDTTTDSSNDTDACFDDLDDDFDDEVDGDEEEEDCNTD